MIEHLSYFISQPVLEKKVIEKKVIEKKVIEKKDSSKEPPSSLEKDVENFLGMSCCFMSSRSKCGAS